MSERNDPIFVVGTGRSGTTLLQALIGSHPRIAAPPETHFFRRVVRFAAAWGDLRDDEQLQRVIEAAVEVPALRNSGFEPDRILARARSGPRTYAGVLDAMMSDFAARHGKVRWSEKSPGQPVHVIWTHLPEAQVVHIVRDPLDTVASNLAKTGIQADPTTSAFYWRWYTLRVVRAGAERGPRHYLRVRYEDLARDPEAVMRIVFAFLGEQFDPRIVAESERRLATTVSADAPLTKQVLQPIKIQAGAAYELLNRQQRARVAAVVADVTVPLGYPRPQRRQVLAGAVLNTVHWPRVWISVVRIRAADRWADPAKRRATLPRLREERVQRRLAKEAARRSAGAGRAAG